MAASLKKAKVAVLGIWAGLVIEVVIGVTKPGAAESVAAARALIGPLTNTF